MSLPDRTLAISTVSQICLLELQLRDTANHLSVAATSAFFRSLDCLTAIVIIITEEAWFDKPVADFLESLRVGREGGTFPSVLDRHQRIELANLLASLAQKLLDYADKKMRP